MRQSGWSAALLIGLVAAAPAHADIADDCDGVRRVAQWTIFAGYGPDVTPEQVVETAPAIDGANIFDNLVWSDERIHDLIRQIVASDFKIDRSEAGLRYAGLYGEFFRLQCVAEAKRNIRFKKLPEAKPAIEECIKTSAKSRSSFELCLLDTTVVEDSWKDYTDPKKESSD